MKYIPSPLCGAYLSPFSQRFLVDQIYEDATYAVSEEASLRARHLTARSLYHGFDDPARDVIITARSP